ncbi:glycerophosphodiester phosphodiesterase [Actinomyces succiniciruminis]|uniref:Glycerophosphodiester phosphodiesterase protein n=1 Tax=Actinomyces succiniciruminis TaxID=1522002 RepID=A0A1L7RHU6_9ACTO|nr:glycerophosphodiester phosphodiesterase [Actinomyces succiniciruminis]CED91266.1 Glycerophosphodiester phosphodiesterase protein [Actinomyces succiniciruminis]
MSPTRRCAVVAHRGGGSEVAENTWSAVEHVAALGLTWMETDLRATADGVVVLSHDADLTRTAGDPRRIAELTWEELAAVDAGDGRPFVRLDQALTAHPGISFNIDLKDSAVLQPALRAVRAADALGRVRFASFSARRLAVLRRQEPRATTSLGVGDVARLMVRSQAALPVRRGRRAGSNEQVDAVQVPISFHRIPVVTPRFISQAHASGMEVHVWTVDDPEQMRVLANSGVDAVITDRPTLALDVLG